MPQIRFWGSSDDIFCWSDGPGYQGGDEVGVIERSVYLRVAAGGEALCVIGHYCPGPMSGWMIGVGRDPDADDAIPLPFWPIRYETGPQPYTPTLVIETPVPATVTEIDAEGRKVLTTEQERQGVIAELRRDAEAANAVLRRSKAALTSAAQEIDRALSHLRDHG